MLDLDPAKRISAEQGLEHAYFSYYHDPEDEVSIIFLEIELLTPGVYWWFIHTKTNLQLSLTGLFESI